MKMFSLIPGILCAGLLMTSANAADQTSSAAPKTAVPAVKAAPAKKAPQVKYVFHGQTEREKDGFVWHNGEEAVFHLTLGKKVGREPEQAVTGRKIKLTTRIEGDNTPQVREYQMTDQPLEIRVKLDHPGCIRMHAELLKLNPDDSKEPGAGLDFGAIWDPEKLDQVVPEPADFDAYWEQVKKEVAAVPMKVKLVPLPQAKRTKYERFDLEISCSGDNPVRGTLFVPTMEVKDKKFPAILSLHSLGVRSADRYSALSGSGFLHLDINANGILNEQKPEYYNELRKTTLNEYARKNRNDKNKYHFRFMYMRMLRALEYLKTRPDWDGKNLIVFGWSQGGAQAIASAALDHDVTLCIAGVPAMNQHFGFMAKPVRADGWPYLCEPVAPADASAEEKAKLTVDPKVVETAGYFDGINFAKRIRCRTYMATALGDDCVSPSTVCTAFNALPGNIQKELVIYNWIGHWLRFGPRAFEILKEFQPVPLETPKAK